MFVLPQKLGTQRQIVGFAVSLWGLHEGSAPNGGQTRKRCYGGKMFHDQLVVQPLGQQQQRLNMFEQTEWQLARNRLFIQSDIEDYDSGTERMPHAAGDTLMVPTTATGQENKCASVNLQKSDERCRTLQHAAR